MSNPRVDKCVEQCAPIRSSLNSQKAFSKNIIIRTLCHNWKNIDATTSFEATRTWISLHRSSYRNIFHWSGHDECVKFAATNIKYISCIDMSVVTRSAKKMMIGYLRVCFGHKVIMVKSQKSIEDFLEINLKIGILVRPRPHPEPCLFVR